MNNRAAVKEASQRRQCWPKQPDDPGVKCMKLTPFTTDGCSAWFQGWWGDACKKHDLPYHSGRPGDWKGKLKADALLAVDVLKSGPWFVKPLNVIIAPAMFVGVSVGGRRAVSAAVKAFTGKELPWRWGYGWVEDTGD